MWIMHELWRPHILVELEKRRMSGVRGGGKMTQERIDAIWELWNTGYPGIDFSEDFNPWDEVAVIIQGMHALEQTVKRDAVDLVIEQNKEVLLKLSRE